MKQLVLYTTSHCHLCEQAEAMLIHLKSYYEVNWLQQEISDDDDLTERYGIRIPVIARMDNQTELNWPFTENDIAIFIKA